MNCAIIIKDAKFFGHITQTILSGQYVVYNGKYYEVHESERRSEGRILQTKLSQ